MTALSMYGCILQTNTYRPGSSSVAGRPLSPVMNVEPRMPIWVSKSPMPACVSMPFPPIGPSEAAAVGYISDVMVCFVCESFMPKSTVWPASMTAKERPSESAKPGDSMPR